MFIVSIGAGKNQLPLIRACKDLQCKIIGVDINPHAEGFPLCDFKIIESIYNYHEIYQSLKELLVFDDIAAIVTRSYGEALRTVSYLCQQFKIPHINYTMIDYCIDKSKFRTIANKTITMPHGFTIDKDNQKNILKLSNITFPCIIKPSQGHAKHNVQLIDSVQHLKASIASMKHSTIMVEEYIEGDEIIVIGFIINKIFYICDISDKVLNAKPYFVDRMHLLPSTYYHYYNQLTNIGQQIADLFLLESTPLLMECVISNNTIYVIEAACEFGGEYLADYAIPARLHYDIFKAFITGITTGKVELPKKNTTASVVKYIMGRQGHLTHYKQVENKKNCIHNEIFANIGDAIQFPENNHNRLGVIVTKGITVEKAIKTANTVLEQMEIIIQ